MGEIVAITADQGVESSSNQGPPLPPSPLRPYFCLLRVPQAPEIEVPTRGQGFRLRA